MILWRMPDGKALDETDADRDAHEYIQCAGSAERMTVEIREVVEGRAQQFAVGRPTGSLDCIPSVATWPGATSP